MAPIPPLIFLVLLFSGARGLAIDQQVLTHDFHHSQPALPPGLQTLCSELSGQCILATPVPQPCYHQPPDFEEARCAKVQSNKTWDVWVLEQPGGYYYVCTSTLNRSLRYLRIPGKLGIMPVRWSYVRCTAELEQYRRYSHR